MVVHLFLNNNKALDFLPINSIKNGGITRPNAHANMRQRSSAAAWHKAYAIPVKFDWVKKGRLKNCLAEFQTGLVGFAGWFVL